MELSLFYKDLHGLTVDFLQETELLRCMYKQLICKVPFKTALILYLNEKCHIYTSLGIQRIKPEIRD